MIAKVTQNEQSKKKKTTSRSVKASGSEKAPSKPAVRADTQKPVATSGTAVTGSKIRIKIKAYDHKIIDTSTRQIVDTALRAGCQFHGPVPLPTEIRRYTVNRSTFVHKDSREQFEIRVHKRFLDILNPTPKLIDALTNLNIPAGVDIEIKTG